ncbi:MAG: TonB family protein, partial [Gammaproteobacteria bacterium]|nr:TonB family protein [Gammaproteobacteria bacterium]
VAVPLGAAVTALLLFMMHGFVRSGSHELESTRPRVVDFVRIERQSTVKTIESKPARPEPPERLPEVPRADVDGQFDGRLNIAIAPPAISRAANVGSLGMTVSDGDYLPIVKVAPVYPTRALARKLEGYVIVEFVVTTSGSVKDIVVVESSAEIFEAAAVEAAAKFRYKPRVVDGTPIDVEGVQNKITFKFDA